MITRLAGRADSERRTRRRYAPRSREPVTSPVRKRSVITAQRDLTHGRINPRASIPFFVVHLLPLLAIFTGVSATAWILFAVTFWGRMFFITAGYHRYFAHRAYKTSRAFQLVLAVGGGTAVQRGPCGGPGTTGSTTASPTPSMTPTPRARASGGATPVGSSRTRPRRCPTAP